MPRKQGQVVINPNDLVGKQIGKLEVIQYQTNWYESTAGGDRMRHSYFCKCECGTGKIIRRSQLKNEKVHSCGCLKRRIESHEFE